MAEQDPTDPKDPTIDELLDLHDRHLTQIACDLHDGLMQYVISARMMTEAVRRRLDERLAEIPAEVETELESIQRNLQRAIAEGRDLIDQLTAGNQESVPLATGLRQLASRMNQEGDLRCDLDVPAGVDLPEPTCRAALRIVQEALHNVVRHSRATVARVVARRRGHAVHLEITDDGRGFDPANVGPSHFGLASMRYRAKSIGGTLSIHSAPGQGTRVTLVLRHGQE